MSASFWEGSGVATIVVSKIGQSLKKKKIS